MKKLYLLFFVTLFLSISGISYSQIISTFAGDGRYGYNGDGGPATAAALRYPLGVALDISRNVYISDISDLVIRKVNTSGIISTFAGSGLSGYSGDGGPATSAEFGYYINVAADGSGNIYIADQYNNRIRKVNTSGIISTFAGNGKEGYSGNGGAATAAELNYPISVAIDTSGNVYISDQGNNRIRVVNTSGTINLYAGKGPYSYFGDGGLATAAEFDGIQYIATDKSGDVYVADNGNERIRKINTSGIISTVVGRGIIGFSGDGGLATAAELYQPYGVDIDAFGNLYISDYSNDRIRKVNTSGIISTYAGTGNYGASGDGGPATAADLNYPLGVATDAFGVLYIVDSESAKVRKVTNNPIVSANVITEVSCYGENNGSASVNASEGTSPYTYSWSPGGGTNSTASGLSAGTYTVTVTDNTGSTTSTTVIITQPPAIQIVIDSINNATGSVTVTASGGTPFPIITTVAGDGYGAIANSGGYSGDGGPATAAELYDPTGVAVDGSGNIFIADQYNYVVWEVNHSTGIINVVAGNHSAGYSGDGGQATASQLFAPWDVAVDNSDNLFIADYGNSIIREVNHITGIISTVAGNVYLPPGYSGDGGSATDAELNLPAGIAFDGSDNLFIADRVANVIREVNHVSGIISTVAGNGYNEYNVYTGGYSGDGGPATAAELNSPTAIAIDGSGNIFIADNGNNVIREVNAAGIISTVAGGGSGGDGLPATSAQLNNPFGVAVDNSDNIYIANTNSNVIQEVTRSTGLISTVAGNGYAGSPGYSGDGGPAVAAALWAPFGVCFDGSGNLFIADSYDNVVREVIFTGSNYYTYRWSPYGGDSSTATGLIPGTYTVTATDANSCTATASVTITQPSLIIVASVTTNVNCDGGNNGSALANASIGTTPYTYSWSPIGGRDSIATGLSAGTYTVTVTDNASKTATASVIVTQPNALSATASITSEISCNGSNNGSASVAPSGGTSPYTYSWSSGGGTNSTASGLSIGTYTVTVQDNCGASATASATITQPNSLGVSASTITNVLCSGTSSGSVSATPSGGTIPYTYSWNPSGGLGLNATGLYAGTYTITIKDICGASATASATITEPVSLSISANTTTNVLCNGASTGSISSTPSGGATPYTYSWSPSGGTSSNATGLSAGTYTITVKDKCGASATASITITQPNSLGLSSNTITNVLCNGASTGSISLTPSGGTTPYTYSWNPSGGINSTATGLSAGTYTLTVRDNNECSITTSVTITQPNSLSVSANTITNVLCAGTSTGSISSTPSGGTTPYTYSWSSGGGAGSSTTGLSASTYTVTVMDICGATASASAAISQPVSLSISASTTTNVLCNGAFTGSALSTPAGGAIPYTYSWSDGGTNSTTSGLSAGTYTVTVADNCGANATVFTIITQPVSLIISASTTTNVLCNGTSTGSVSATPSGGMTPYTYSWSPNGGAASTAIALSVGTYTITILDNNGCSGTQSTTITQPAGINVSASTTTNVLCNGLNTGSVSSATFGGITPYTYLWNPSGGAGSTATGLSAGVYAITVTDNNGCSETASVKINGVNVKPEITGLNSICAGTSTILTARDTSSTASGNTTFLWNTSATTSGITVSSPNTYSVVIYNGTCSDSTSIKVIMDNPNVNVCCDTIIQSGSFAQLNAIGALHYNWTASPPGVINCDTCANVIVTPTVTTTYTIAATDPLGCPTEKTIVVTVETPCMDVVVPNVFTPANAGPNGVDNVFYIKPTDMDSWSILIYDRWGKEVFKSTNPIQYWNGTTESGAQAPDGIYYYDITGTCQNTNYHKEGFVQLIR